MAQQAGPLRLKGRLGDLSFYHHKQYGYLIRQKGGPSKAQIKMNAKFERTRENNSEFALAVITGKLIRRAIKGVVGAAGDSTVSQRLTGLLIRLGKMDLLSPRGMRAPSGVFNDPAARELMRSFAFFEDGPLTQVFRGQIHCDLSGATIFMDTVSPESFRAPKGATHVRIKACIIDFDFTQSTFNSYPAPIYISSLEPEMTQPYLDCGAIGAVPSGNTIQRIGVVQLNFCWNRMVSFTI